MGNLLTNRDPMATTQPMQQASMRYFELNVNATPGEIQSSMMNGEFSRHFYILMTELIINIDDHWDNTMYDNFAYFLPMLKHLTIQSTIPFHDDPVLQTPKPLRDLAPQLVSLDLEHILHPNQVKYIRGMLPLFVNETTLRINTFQLHHICNDSDMNYLQNVANVHLRINAADVPLSSDPIGALYEWATTPTTMDRGLTCIIESWGHVINEKCCDFFANQERKASTVIRFSLIVNGFDEDWSEHHPQFETAPTVWSLFANTHTNTLVHVNENNVTKDTVVWIHRMLLPLIQSSATTDVFVTLSCGDVFDFELKIQQDIIDFLNAVSQWIVSGATNEIDIYLTIILPQSSRRWNMQQKWFASRRFSVPMQQLSVNTEELYTLPDRVTGDAVTNPLKRRRNE